LSVELSDSAGNRLNLAAGRTADIRIPLATRAANPPASVPLYYLDESTGRWVEDGVATLHDSAAGRYYAASVRHFSIFNVDFRGSFILYSSCLQDANGAAVATAPVNSDGLDYSGSAAAITDTSGRFSVPVRKGGRANVFSISGSRASNGVAVGPSEVDFESSTCLQLSDAETGAPPQLTRQPADATVLVGDRAEFDVFVQSAVPARYQWQRNGQEIPGATGSYYSLEPTTADDDRAQFSVVVSNDVGNVTSRTATLTVSATVEPLIAVQPQNVTAIAGETARFAVGATGGRLQYQWRRDGVAIDGATASSYTTPATTLADDGAQFSVAVSNASGQAQSAVATLTVQAAPTPPTISLQPQNVSVAVGATAQFSVVASGTSLHFQWQRDGVAIAGATGASYTTPPVTAADNGARFRVTVSNAGGSVSSAEVTLGVDAGGASHQMRVVRLIATTLDLGDFGSIIDQLTNATNALRAPSSVCSGGSAAESLNTVAVVGGEQLPLPVGTLAATFSACRLVPGLTYDGAISLRYAFSAANRLDGSVEASASNLRRSRMAALAFQHGNDITIRGGYAYAFLNQVAGNAVTRLTTVNPAAGATLTDNGSGLIANFTTGGVSIQRTGSVDTAGTFVPRLTRYSYSALTWNIDSVAYAANGSFESSNEIESAGGSGEVVIRSGEVTIGRIFASAAGVFVEAGGEVEPL
jgi:hypothetical protein